MAKTKEMQKIKLVMPFRGYDRSEELTVRTEVAESLIDQKIAEPIDEPRKNSKSKKSEQTRKTKPAPIAEETITTKE